MRSDISKRNRLGELEHLVMNYVWNNPDCTAEECRERPHLAGLYENPPSEPSLPGWSRKDLLPTRWTDAPTVIERQPRKVRSPPALSGRLSTNSAAAQLSSCSWVWWTTLSSIAGHSKSRTKGRSSARCRNEFILRLADAFPGSALTLLFGRFALGIPVCSGLWLFRARNAAWQYAVWRLTLFAMLALPLASISRACHQTPGAPCNSLCIASRKQSHRLSCGI